MATVSPLHSEDGRKLLDIIDKLKLLPSISHEIALPQIVVVGQQSSGKSSVLKAISNIDFPTNSGFCTQFATEIICRRETVESTKVQIIPATDIDDRYQQRLEAFSAQWSQVPPGQDISEVIESAKQVMGLNRHRRISKDVLRFEFSGPKQDHISLIDLPGLFEQELPGQRENDKQLVDEMVRDYISGSQTIILAVVSGAYDVQVQRIFRMFEQHQDRTLGIITAPDLVENGTARASTFGQLVSNSSFKAGHGWHVLRNLSHREEQEGRNRDEVEESFFATRSSDPLCVWSVVPDSRVGIKNLKHKLATLLQGAISEGLPQIQRQLHNAHQICDRELKLLGGERATSEQQRDYLAEKGEMLRAHTLKELSGGRHRSSLRSQIRNLNDGFAENMTKSGAYWQFVRQKPDAAEISELAPGDPILIADHEWVSTMLDEITNSRGRELDGLVDNVWVGVMFLRQSRKWKNLAECHAEEAFKIVEQYFMDAVEQVVGPAEASRFFVGIIEPELERRNNALTDKVSELLTPYENEHITTLNRSFRKSNTDLGGILRNGKDKRSLMRNTIAHYTDMMIEYYNIALNVFIDNIESLAIENVLLRNLQDVLTATKAHKMSCDEVAALASDSDEIVERRIHLQERMRDYEEGRKIISRYSLKAPRTVQSQPAKSHISQASQTSTQTTSRVPKGQPVGEEQASVLEENETAPASTRSSPERSRDPRNRILSTQDSSRDSSVASRTVSEDDETLSSGPSTTNSTPLRVRISKRHKFESSG